MVIAELPNGAFETKDAIYERAQIVKQFCRDFLLANPVEGDEKIGFVTHSTLIAAVTADGFEGEGRDAHLTNFLFPANCEIVPLDF